PAVRHQCKANLNIQMLCQKQAEIFFSTFKRLATQLLDARDIDRHTQIRVCYVCVLQLSMRPSLNHLRRELIQHWQECLVLDPAIPDAAGIVQFGLKYARRWRLRLRRGIDYKALRTRSKSAG